ncbi:MAG: adenylate/guanylate cyclase domain-containing protein [Candidatus Rokuibacteriota bacterium]
MATSGATGLSGKAMTAGPSARPGCLKCVRERLAGRNYCGACGNLLRPRRERKHVTVLFADVSGFTVLSERLDPEQVSEIMDRTLEVVLQAVHEHGGTVNQFLGDGVMALFGDGPLVHHACRALGAALAIQERLETVRDEVRRSYGLAFRVRIGVNTGPVVIGTIGAALRTDYTATGTTASVASGLLHIAEPGQIVLTEDTRVLAAGYYDFAEIGAIPLTESRETVVVYELSRESVEYAESADLISV